MSTEKLTSAHEQSAEIYDIVSDYHFAEQQNGYVLQDAIINDHLHTTYGLFRGTTTQDGNESGAYNAAQSGARSFKDYFADNTVDSSLQSTSNPKLVESFMRRGWQESHGAIRAEDNVDVDFAIAKPVFVNGGPHWAVLTKGNVAAFLSSSDTDKKQITDNDGKLRFSLHPIIDGAKLTFATPEVVAKSNGEAVSQIGVQRGLQATTTQKTIETFLQLSDNTSGKSLLVCQPVGLKPEQPKLAPKPRKTSGLNFEKIQALAAPTASQEVVETPQQRRERIASELADLRNQFADAEANGVSDDKLAESKKRYEQQKALMVEEELSKLDEEVIDEDLFKQYKLDVEKFEQFQLDVARSNSRLLRTGDYRKNRNGEIVKTNGAKLRKFKKWIGGVAAAVLVGKNTVQNPLDTPAPLATPAATVPEITITDKDIDNVDEMNYYTVDAPTPEIVSASPGWLKQRVNKYTNIIVGTTHAERRVRAGGALAIALGVVAVTLASRAGLDINPFDGFDGSGGNNHDFNNALPSDDRTVLTPEQTPTSPHDTVPNGSHDSKGLTNHAEPWNFDKPETVDKQHVILSAGDSPWSVAEHVLGPNASIAEIDEYKDRILELNNISEYESYHLDIGFRLELPDRSLASK